MNYVSTINYFFLDVDNIYRFITYLHNYILILKLVVTCLTYKNNTIIKLEAWAHFL